MNLLLKLLVFAVAVQMPGLAPTAQVDVSPTPPAFDQIRLVRTSCFGSCPAYSITINGDGGLIYEGVRFVRKEGRVKARLSPAQVGELRRALQVVDFYSLRDTYASRDDGCPMSVIDGPSAITTVTVGGRTKTIRHDLGCTEHPVVPEGDLPLGGATYPRPLAQFERQIDEITNSRQWVQVPAEGRR